METPIRILVAKAGLDGHDRGAKVVAAGLRDAGMEVVYTGLHQTPEQIIEAAIQEDVEVIGISSLAGAHMTLFKKVIDLLRAQEAARIMVIGGGIIPEDDIAALEKMGVANVFGPGTDLADIAEWIKNAVMERRTKAATEKSCTDNTGGCDA